jgi:hypothetical protein
VAGRTVALLNDLLHPAAKPSREAERRDDATNLVLQVVVLVAAVRGVVMMLSPTTSRSVWIRTNTSWSMSSIMVYGC